MEKASPDFEAFCASCMVIPRARTGLQTVQRMDTLLPVQLTLRLLATRGKAWLWWAAISSYAFKDKVYRNKHYHVQANRLCRRWHMLLLVQQTPAFARAKPTAQIICHF